MNEPLQNGKNFKTRLQELIPKVFNSDDEWGYGNQNPNENPNINSNTMNVYNPSIPVTEPNGRKMVKVLIAGQELFGYMHTHPNEPDVAGIHSMGDMYSFLEIVYRRARAELPTDNTYGIVVGNHGIYALKIDNINDFMSGYGSFDNALKREFWKKFKKDYERIVENRTLDQNNQADNEKVLLQLLKKYQFDTGIGVYRANESLNNWAKIELNANGNVHSVPCN